MNLSSRIPGIVHSVDRARREVRVQIPGLTDGASQFPLAEVEYPVGDKSEHTEIRIVPGDRVWLAFENGDPRYPIITGFRAKHTGNDLYWRRFHHENHEREALAGDIKDIATQDIKSEAGRDITEVAGRDITLTAARDIVLDAVRNITGEAGAKAEYTVGACTVTITTSSITLSANGSTLVMSAAGIFLNGTLIGLN